MKSVGVTETYDPCYVEDLESKLLPEANIIITKKLTRDLSDIILSNSNRVILHHTITGHGGSELEPGVRDYRDEINSAYDLFNKGFPRSNYVLRLDPIIPISNDHLKKSFYVLDRSSELLYDGNPIRCRISVLDMYPHVVNNLQLLGLNHWNSFHAPKQIFEYIEDLLKDYSDRFLFESCAESKFSDEFIRKVGCINYEDLEILSVDKSEYSFPKSKQRTLCNCLMKKQILGVKPSRCPNRCIYCYWK